MLKKCYTVNEMNGSNEVENASNSSCLIIQIRRSADVNQSNFS